MVVSKCIKGKSKTSTSSIPTNTARPMPSTDANKESNQYLTYLGIEYDPSKAIKSKSTKLQTYKVNMNFSGLILPYKVKATSISQAKDRAWAMYGEDCRKNPALPKVKEFTSCKVVPLNKKQ